MTGTGRSSHFSRDILDIRLFSKDSGFSRMVEWAGTRRTGIRWKPYKDVAKASTRRRFHLGNLREHSIVAVITRIRGNRQLYLRFFFLTSFKFREQPKPLRFSEFMWRRGVDRYPNSLPLFHRVFFLLRRFIRGTVEFASHWRTSRAWRTRDCDLWTRFEIAFAKGKVAWWWRLQIRKARWLVHGNFRDLNDTHWLYHLLEIGIPCRNRIRNGRNVRKEVWISVRG